MNFMETENTFSGIEFVVPVLVVKHKLVIFHNTNFVVADDIEGLEESWSSSFETRSVAKCIPAFHGAGEEYIHLVLRGDR
jgi:hypothetical protein